MKWVLYALSLYLFLVAVNATFLMPGKYDWFNFGLASSAILAAVALAWLGKNKFGGPQQSHPEHKLKANDRKVLDDEDRMLPPHD